MMASMKDFLTTWGYLDLVPTFQDNDIDDLDTLGDLLQNNEATIEGLIPIKLGVILTLKKNYNQYISEVSATPGPASNIDYAVPGTSSGWNEQIANVQQAQTSDIKLDEANFVFNLPYSGPQNTVDPRIENVLIEIAEEQHEALQNQKESTVQEPPFFKNFDLKQLLSKSAIGRSLLVVSKYAHEFDTTCQSYLCDIIVLHFLDNNITEINKEGFKSLARQIRQVFPHEVEETFFAPGINKEDSKTDKSILAKGKLVDKFRNRRTFIRNSIKLKENWKFHEMYRISSSME